MPPPPSILETIQPTGTRLNLPLDPDAPEAAVLLDDIPGNILASHGRFFTRLYFVRFPGAAQAVPWLKQIAEEITTAAGQKSQSRLRAARQKEREELLAAGLIPGQEAAPEADGGLFVGLSLTAVGADLIGKLDHLPAGPAFRDGAPSRAGALGEGTERDPLLEWNPPTYAKPEQIHAVVQLAFNKGSEADADTFFTTWLEGRADVTVHATEEGGRFTDDEGRNLEHFGYVDGTSRMHYFTPDRAPSTQHTKEADFTFRLDHVLQPMPKNDQTCGSFLVFRKLEQDVEGFRTEVGKLAAQASGATADLAGAAVVGRFQDGTPLAMQRTAGLGAEDDFTFNSPKPDQGQTRGGRECPFHGHVRKMNPRGDPDVDDTGTPVRDRQPTRRSMPYGVRTLTVSGPHERVLAPDLPAAGERVGLLFVVYVRNIEEQFEHLVINWANNARFPHNNSRLDPLIGRQQGRNFVRMAWPRAANGSTPPPCSFASCVTSRGAVYCFAPPRSFFRGL